MTDGRRDGRGGRTPAPLGSHVRTQRLADRIARARYVLRRLVKATRRRIGSVAAAVRPTDPSEVRRSDVHQSMLVAVNALAGLFAVALAGGDTAGAVAFVAAAVGVGLLDRERALRLAPSTLDDVPALALRGVVIAVVATAFGLPVFWEHVPWGRNGMGPVVTATLYLAVAVASLSLGHGVLRQLRLDGRLGSRALIVGAGPTAASVGRRLVDHPEYGLVLV